MSITKGPWDVDGDSPQWVKTPSRHVALAFSGDDHGHANARLIAAAPETTEALKGFLSRYDGWDIAQLQSRYDREWVAAILAGRTALAKATGEGG